MTLLRQANAPILSRLTYVSRAKPDLSSEDLKEILGAARLNNQRSGITGMLCFNNRYFLQTIEGARGELSNLLNRLSGDNRHFDIQVLDSREITRRSWSEWSMNYASPTRENKHIFMKHSPSASFNPYLLSAAGAESLLTELHELNENKRRALSA